MQSPQSPPPVLVTLTPSQVDIAPGSPPAEMNISVRNTGQTVDQYAIEIEGLDPGWYALDVQSLSLFPGDSFDGKLTVSLPQGSRPVAGAYPFAVQARSRSNPQVVGIVQGLVRVGQGAAVRTATTQQGGRRSLWPPLLLLGLAVAAFAVAGYFVLGSGLTSKPSATPTPIVSTVVAQNLPTATPPRPPTPVPQATSTPRVQPTAVCGTWAVEHRGKQNTRFTPGVTDQGPFNVAGRQYKYRAIFTSVQYVDATGVISSVRVANLDAFEGGHQQTETITGTLISGTNIHVPLFTWTCDPGNLVSLHVNLDDNAKTGIPYSCSENMAGTYKPDGGTLSSLKGYPAGGNWVLEMDVYSNEEWPTSYFNSWGLEMCAR